VKRQFDSRISWILLSLGIALAYAFTAKLCVVLSGLVANVSWSLYIPAGLSLTCSLLWGSKVWPAIFAGELGMGLLTGQSTTTSLIMAGGNALDAGLAGWWFHDRLGRRLELDRVRDVVQLLAAELLILQPLCATIGILALRVTSGLPAQVIPSTWAAWYSANLYSMFIIAPTVLAWLRWPRPATRKREYAELAVLLGLTLAVGVLGPGRWAVHRIPLPGALILIFPLLVWASARFVPSVAVTVAALIGLLAFDAALGGDGSFMGMALEQRMLTLNIFMSVSIGTGLFLASAMANERRREAEQAELILKLRASAAQVSRLEEIVTFCAWTGRIRWNDQWVKVETFLHERYNLNISHGISDEAMKRILGDAGLELPPRLAEPPAS
jgi:integral membrane sensor domain MASE1